MNRRRTVEPCHFAKAVGYAVLFWLCLVGSVGALPW